MWKSIVEPNRPRENTAHALGHTRTHTYNMYYYFAATVVTGTSHCYVIRFVCGVVDQICAL